MKNRFRLVLAAAMLAAQVYQVHAAQPAPQPNQLQVYSAFSPIVRAPDTSATTSSGTTETALGGSGPVAWVCNVGSVFVYVMFGSATIVVTAATGFPIPANSCTRMNASGATHVAAITASDTATVQVTLGTGSP